MPTTTSASKKAKMAKESSEDFELVRKYLLECPHLSKNHPAIKAALDGVDMEIKRRERDLKLQRKFAGVSADAVEDSKSSSAEVSTVAPLSSSETSDVVVVDTTANSQNGDTDAEIMDWQDIGASKKDESDDGTGFLGRELAKIAIDSISEHQIKVKSPIAAIAVALHASLRSDMLGFACTGIPEDEAAPKGGFAPPIRELPKHQFLPPKWDAHASSATLSPSDQVRLRYRKNGTGALILSVFQEEAGNIQVHLLPTSSQEPPTQSLQFALNEHVNLDSWNAALKGASSVPPSLHYKGLAALLTCFCRTFDLGSIKDNPLDFGNESIGLPYVDNTISHAASNSGTHPMITKSDFVPPQPPPEIPGTATSQRRPWDGAGARVPTTIDQAFPLHANPRGDFAADLAPAGLIDPRFAPRDGRMGGSQMGPNHPFFLGNGGGIGPNLGGPIGGGYGGPGSLQPRFDPVYPTGRGDDGLGDNRRPGGPRRPLHGEPNPDHLRKPDFGHDMFS